MSKKSTKTVEQLTEEFFAAERAEYEKRTPASFPRVETAALAEPDEEPAEPVEEKSKGKG